MFDDLFTKDELLAYNSVTGDNDVDIDYLEKTGSVKITTDKTKTGYTSTLYYCSNDKTNKFSKELITINNGNI